MTAEELNIIITAQNDDFKRRIDEVNSRLDNMEHTSDNATKSMGNGFKTLAGIIGSLGIAKIIGDLNDAYTTQMMNEVKLETVMRNRIKASDDEIDSIKRLTSAQQQLGIIGDEVQLAGAQQLATFATSASTVETLIPAMNNLMAQQNGFNSTESSAVSIANMMGKALQGQTSALTRVGISFTEAQENVLKYGTEAEKAATMAQVITDNVGNMNEALRKTNPGQLQATKNDFGDLKELIGETFQPLLTTIIPMVNEGLQTVSPLILSLSSGIAGVAQYIAELSPTAKTMLTISLPSAVAIPAVTMAMFKYNAVIEAQKRKLDGLTAKQLRWNKALKTSLGWLMVLMAVLSIVADIGATAREMNSSEGEAMQDTADGADAASASVDGLADSYAGLGDSADSAKKSLLDIDTLNVFDGGSAGTAGMDFTAAVDGANSAQEAFDEAMNAAGDLEDELNNNFDLSGLYNTFNTTFSDIGGGFDTMWKAFFGSGDEQYQSLLVLNEKVKQLFGEDWTTFWNDVGTTINKAFGEGGSEYDRFMALTDIQGWLELIDTTVRTKVDQMTQGWGIQLGTWWHDFWYDKGLNDFSSTNTREMELSNDFSTLYADINDALLENLKQGMDPEEALKAAKDKNKVGNNWESLSLENQYYNEQGWDKSLNLTYAYELEKLLEQSGQITPAVDTSQYQFVDYQPPTSTLPSYQPNAPADLSVIFPQAEDTGARSFNFEIHNTVELDGDKVGESVTNYQTRENAKSNGY